MDTNHTVLLVDDESAVRDGVAQALESAGYRVARCRDGSDAIAWLREHPMPDLLIGDVHMPDVDGFELRTRAHALHPELSVLLITGDPRIGTDSDGRATGPLLYKPFTRRELLDMAEQVIVNNRSALSGNAVWS